MGVALVARQALAHHRPEGQRLHHAALCVFPAGLGGTQVLAPIIDAGHSLCAIYVRLAGWLYRAFVCLASERRVALGARGTHAHAAVVLWPAGGVRGTAGVQASLYAISVFASSVVWALVVGAALQVLAFYIRVALQAGWAAALCLVAGCKAFGTDCTRVPDVARVNALSVIAPVCRWAFRVCSAARWSRVKRQGLVVGSSRTYLLSITTYYGWIRY